MSPIVVGLDSGRWEVVRLDWPTPAAWPVGVSTRFVGPVRHLSMRFFAFGLNGVEQLISLEMVTFVKTTGRRRLRVDRLGEIGIALW